MKGFRYHREFWLDFHFWILVLLLAAFDSVAGLSTACIDTEVHGR